MPDTVEAGERVGVRVPLAVDEDDDVLVRVDVAADVLVWVDVAAAVTDDDGVMVGTGVTVDTGVTSGFRE